MKIDLGQTYIIRKRKYVSDVTHVTMEYDLSDYTIVGVDDGEVALHVFLNTIAMHIEKLDDRIAKLERVINLKGGRA